MYAQQYNSNPLVGGTNLPQPQSLRMFSLLGPWNFPVQQHFIGIPDSARCETQKVGLLRHLGNIAATFNSGPEQPSPPAGRDLLLSFDTPTSHRYRNAP